MLIALLLALGVDLIVVVVLVGTLIARRRWVKRQNGVFAGKIRAVAGDVDGLSPKWKGGFGRWVGNVLVWTRAPLLFRNEVIAVDRLLGHRQEALDNGRPGKETVIMQFAAATGTIEIAAQGHNRESVAGPWPPEVEATAP